MMVFLQASNVSTLDSIDLRAVPLRFSMTQREEGNHQGNGAGTVWKPQLFRQHERHGHHRLQDRGRLRLPCQHY